MKRRKLFWLIFPAYLIIIILSLAFVTGYSGRQVSSLYFEETARALEVHAQLINHWLTQRLIVDSTLSIDSLCQSMGMITGCRVTVVDTTGRVLGDSYHDPRYMENHKQRPEISQALVGRADTERRFSATLHENMMYVAVPWINDGKVVGAVRTAVSIDALTAHLSSMYLKLTIFGFLVALLAVGVSIIVLRRLTRPLRQLQDGASQIAQGVLETKLVSSRAAEIDDLAEAMNKMAADLDQRIRTIAQKNSEQKVIFSSMIEGVLALDRNEHVVDLNRAAAALLGLDHDLAIGRKLHEIIRNTRLYALVEQSLRDGRQNEMEISLTGEPDRHLQVRSTPLRDDSGTITGALLVYNDISRIKRLETIRRDFVANVSHELRTPITAITGSIETLLDNPSATPEDSRRFLSIIAKHTERLARIVEDLLDLAHLENEGEESAIELRPERIADVVTAAIAACRHNSDLKNIAIEVSCPPLASAEVNASQLEHAITNLIDNAIKYSDNGATITVEVSSDETDLVIAVRDQGVGIDAKHLPRLFERFYRVDSARSRDLGGTGLGLAIVKHIALAHGGNVSVESSLGRGSTFQVRVPLHKAQI